MYYRTDEGTYRRMSVDDRPIVSRLPAGAYVESSAEAEDARLALQPRTLSTEPLLFLDTPAMRMVRREVEAFFDPATTARLASAGIRHRRGIILHGPPGTGKTSIMRQLVPRLVEHDAVIVVDCDPNQLEHAFIPAIRASDPDRPIVLFFDDFDQSAANTCSALLQLLDGLTSPDHLLTIGCTDDLEAVPVQLRNRPSRFGLILRIDRLPEGLHERLAEQKYPTLSPADRQFAVRLTRELPIKYLDDVCKLLLLGNDPGMISDRMRAIAATRPAAGHERS